MNKHALELLHVGNLVLSAFLVVFVVANYWVSTQEVTVPDELRFKASGPMTMPMLKRDWHRWKRLNGLVECPRPCLGCKDH